MADKFKVVRQVECSICKGAGKISHPDGDIERCTRCHGIGHWDSEATVEDVLRECGGQEQPVGTVDRALQSARYHLDNAPADVASAIVLYAIAEQLALLNKHMAELSNNVDTYIAYAV